MGCKSSDDEDAAVDPTVAVGDVDDGEWKPVGGGDTERRNEPEESISFFEEHMPSFELSVTLLLLAGMNVLSNKKLQAEPYLFVRMFSAVFTSSVSKLER